MLAGLPYVVWPIGSLFILASSKKDDPFLHYHAIQGLLTGLVMGVVALLSFVVMTIFFRILPGSQSLIPGLLGMGMFFGGGLIAMAVFFTAIFLGWRATAGEMLRMPFLGDYAEEKMLDHTGMTRRQFMGMLEESLIEPNAEEEAPIPFPDEVGGKAPRLTPSAAKQAAIQAHRPPTDKPARVAPPLSAISRETPAGSPPTASEVVRRTPATATRASAESQPAALGAPLAARQPEVPSRVKSYPLISGTAHNVLSPSPPQRSAQPPQRAQAPSGWQAAPGGGQPSAPSQQHGHPIPAKAPQVKDVDLVKHYKERRNAPPPGVGNTIRPAGQQKSDALKQWLSSVDNDSTP